MSDIEHPRITEVGRLLAEIDRLREDCAVFMASNASLTNRVLDLRDERDRLREALERIVREWDAAPGPVYHQLREYWLVETMAPAIDAARAVLTKEAGQ
jgi:hypothetical protein